MIWLHQVFSGKLLLDQVIGSMALVTPRYWCFNCDIITINDCWYYMKSPISVLVIWHGNAWCSTFSAFFVSLICKIFCSFNTLSAVISVVLSLNYLYSDRLAFSFIDLTLNFNYWYIFMAVKKYLMVFLGRSTSQTFRFDRMHMYIYNTKLQIWVCFPTNQYRTYISYIFHTFVTMTYFCSHEFWFDFVQFI